MTSPTQFRPGKPTQLTQVSVIQADPAAGTQVSGPIALMWDPSPSDGRPRRALACAFSLCRAPACPCREVRVSISVVDDRISGIRDESDGRIGIFCRPEAVEQLSVHWGSADGMLDLDSGELTLKAVGDGTDEPGSANSGEGSSGQLATFIGDLFRRSADAVLLDHLRERWRALKGKTDDWKKFDWAWFEPGEMVGWHDVFPKGADGAFEVDGRMVVPVDMYCVDPACDCAEAMVDFIVIPDAQNERSRMIGRVAVGLTSGKARNFDPRPGESKLLRDAWKEYSAHSGLSRLLTGRQWCMKNVGRELLKNRKKRDASGPEVSVAAPSSQPRRKVGPNEPCPCGSGVKFKRCCMT